MSSPQSGDKAMGTSKELPHQRWKDEMPFKKSLKGSWQEAFAKDSDLGWQAREDFFKTNCPHFNWEMLCDLSDVFQDIISHVSLLDSQIYKIQEVWTRQGDLQYANNGLKTSPRFCSFSVLYHLWNFPRSWA